MFVEFHVSILHTDDDFEVVLEELGGWGDACVLENEWK